MEISVEVFTSENSASRKDFSLIFLEFIAVISVDVLVNNTVLVFY